MVETKHTTLFFLKFLFFFFSIQSVEAQIISPSILKDPWKAQWITGPGQALNRYLMDSDETLTQFGVYKFRKSFDLSSLPSSFIIHVSADNRYKLYVNEKLVSLGPARGDLYFWNFETVDIAPYLQQGKNIIAAVVWNFAGLRPEAQITYRSGFILQGNTTTEEILNTNNSWKTIRDSSYGIFLNNIPAYYVAGPVELIHMAKTDKGWAKKDFDDRDWTAARAMVPGLTKDASIDATGWMLVPSSIPQMELTVQRFGTVRRSENISIPPSFPASKTSIAIPAHTKATILLDQNILTNAYPTIIFSGGKNAGLSLGYAEALFVVDSSSLHDTIRRITRITGKGNRNEVEGKIFIGTKDSIVSDGSSNQNFTPLWWRTFRYVQLKINTSDEALVIEDIFSTFTGYPFQFNAKFESSDSSLQKLLDIGWHTARLCAYETYMDCPYYEQLQYIGDTRIQALVTLYNSGDDRLVRNALSLMDHSRIAEGITLSRWPSFTHQQIPTFSLWYIGMLYDYFKYRPDSNFVKEKLPGEREILSWFGHYQQKDGSLRDVPYWNFTDWLGKKRWGSGMAPTGKNGESAVLDLQLMWTYQVAAELESKLGLKDLSNFYKSKAVQLKQTIQKKYWDGSKNMYADTEEKDVFSQHANSLAILSGLITGEKATTLGKRMLTDTILAPASIYFKYYLHLALVKAGLGNDYLNWLQIWKENIRLGLTTWAEISDVSGARSDCHAWGSSPNIELFRIVLGIDTDAPGFQKVKIEPRLGSLTKASGEIPHPDGKISVSYLKQDDKWTIEIILPKNIKGSLVWKGKIYLLKGGKNSFNI